MNAIKRFGSAMIVPVLMFAFFGIVLGFATLFKNPTIMGSLADQHTFWFKFWSVIESGGWVIFTHMEIVFVVGLPLSLAKKAPGHAALAALMGYLMFNYQDCYKYKHTSCLCFYKTILYISSHYSFKLSIIVELVLSIRIKPLSCFPIF